MGVGSAISIQLTAVGEYQVPASLLRVRIRASLPRLVWYAGLTTAMSWFVVPGASAQSSVQQRTQVPGEVYQGEPLKEIGAIAAASLRGQFDRGRSSFAVELDALPDSQRRALRTANEKPGAPLQIGIERQVPSRFLGSLRSRDLAWVEIGDGGTAATFTVRSPRAAATRLALRVANLPPSAEIRFFSVAQPHQSFGPFGRDVFRAHARAAGSGGDPTPYWSPVVGGDSIGVEVYVRRPTQRDSVELTIERVAHLVYSPKYSDPADLVDLKASQGCEIDLACESGWQTAGNAVARIVFQDGGTYLCTGQLMSDGDSSTTIPYFSTATHCIGNQGAASSIDFFWFDQRTGCGGGGTTTQQTSGGADLLYASDTDSGTDFALLRANQSPPGGVSLLGWDSGSVGLGTPITGIHHPAGDVKKISHGTLNSREPWWAQGFDSHLLVNWNSGVTEGGSSGSVLFTGSSWPGQLLIGVLTGGSSYCSAPDDPDLYGRFDLSYPDVSQWLASGGGGGGGDDGGGGGGDDGGGGGGGDDGGGGGGGGDDGGGGGGGDDGGGGTTTPDAPLTFAVSVSGSLANFSWTPAATVSSGATRAGGVPTSFVLEIGTSPGAVDVENTDVGNTNSASATLDDGTYYARVRASNDAGPSDTSNEETFTVDGSGNPTVCTAVPGAPTTLTNSVAGSTVMLNWSSPGDGANAPTSYLLEAGTAPGLANLVSSNQGNTTSLTAHNVGKGTYYVRVRAVNECGTGDPSADTVVVVGGGAACTAAPGAPSALMATVSGSTVRLTWSAPTSTSSGSQSLFPRANEPTTFIVQAGSAPGLSNLANANLNSIAPSLTAVGVGPGTYYVRILGRNSCGTGRASNEIVVNVN